MTILIIDQTGWKTLTINGLRGFTSEEIISFDHSEDMIKYKLSDKKADILIHSIDEVTNYIDEKGSYLFEITEEIERKALYFFESIKDIKTRILIGSAWRFNSRYKKAIDFLVYKKNIFQDWENEDSDSIMNFLKIIKEKPDLKLPRKEQKNHKFFHEYERALI